jgi:hypothetical protein
MAILNPWEDPYSYKNATDSTEYAVQGKMIATQLDIGFADLLKVPAANFNDMIKKQLLERLMLEVAQNRCVEFTRQEDPVSGQQRFRARMFVVPDTMVRILRVSQKNNNG